MWEEAKNSFAEYVRKRSETTQDFKEYLQSLYMLWKIEKEKITDLSSLKPEGKKFAENFLGSGLLPLEHVKVLEKAKEYYREDFADQINKILEEDIRKKIEEYRKEYEIPRALVKVENLLLSETYKAESPRERLEKLRETECYVEYIKERRLIGKKFINREIDFETLIMHSFALFRKIFGRPSVVEIIRNAKKYARD